MTVDGLVNIGDIKKQKSVNISGAKPVEKSTESGIIKLNRKIERREKNIGTFANLEIPMQKRYVLVLLSKKYQFTFKKL